MSIDLFISLLFTVAFSCLAPAINKMSPINRLKSVVVFVVGCGLLQLILKYKAAIAFVLANPTLIVMFGIVVLLLVVVYGVVSIVRNPNA